MIPHSKPFIREGDIASVLETLHKGMVARGRTVSQLESRFVAFTGAAGARATSSGSSALIQILKAAGVGSGDTVAMPSYVCPSVPSAVMYCGATPAFLDVGNDYLIDPDSRPSKKRYKAIVIPYVMGIWKRYDSLHDVAEIVIEDYAQHFPESFEWQGDYAFFSFQATKYISSGEGGIALARGETDSQKLLAQKKEHFDPSPISDIQAALACSQFDSASSFLNRRIIIAEQYSTSLAHIPRTHLPQFKHTSWFRFPVQVQKDLRADDALIAQFAQKGVAIRRPVTPLSHHLFPGCRDSALDMTERLYRQTISLPLYPALDDNQIRTIINTARTILKPTA